MTVMDYWVRLWRFCNERPKWLAFYCVCLVFVSILPSDISQALSQFETFVEELVAPLLFIRSNSIQAYILIVGVIAPWGVRNKLDKIGQ